MIALRRTTPETRVWTAKDGYGGITLWMIFASCTLPPTGTWAIFFNSGGFTTATGAGGGVRSADLTKLAITGSELGPLGPMLPIT